MEWEELILAEYYYYYYYCYYYYYLISEIHGKACLRLLFLSPSPKTFSLCVAFPGYLSCFLKSYASSLLCRVRAATFRVQNQRIRKLEETD